MTPKLHGIFPPQKMPVCSLSNATLSHNARLRVWGLGRTLGDASLHWCACGHGLSSRMKQQRTALRGVLTRCVLRTVGAFLTAFINSIAKKQKTKCAVTFDRPPNYVKYHPQKMPAWSHTRMAARLGESTDFWPELNLVSALSICIQLPFTK